MLMPRSLWIVAAALSVGGCEPAPCPDATDGGHGAIRLPAALGGVCAPRCGGPADCPEGTICSRARYRDDDGHTRRFELVCLPSAAAGRPPASPCAVPTEATDCESRSCHQGQCVVACADDGDCLPGQRCREVVEDGHPARLCWYPDALAVIDLGVHDLDDGGVTPPLTFALPPSADGVGILALDASGGSLPLAFVTLRDPDGRALFDLDDALAWRDPPVRWLPIETHGAAAMLVPNSTPDRVPFGAGRWTVRGGLLPGAPGGRVHLSATAAQARPGTLALNIHLAPGLGVDASTAPTDPRLQGVLETVDAIYQPRGLRVAAERYLDDVPPQHAVIDSTEGPESEAADLLRRSVGGGLDVFLVRSIGGDAPTLGLAGGVPGPFGEPGTSHSGVLVSYDTAVVGDGTLIAAQLMAHEIGHYLGLFHTQEGAPPCEGDARPPACAPFGGQDPLADTSESPRNLMFWALQTFEDGSVNDELTEGQGFVLLRNPLVLP